MHSSSYNVLHRLRSMLPGFSAGAERLAPGLPAPAASSFKRFVLLLSLLIVALFVQTRPEPNGDFLEYSATTIALARHGTPDIRPADIDVALRLVPDRGTQALFQKAKEAILRGEQTPLPGYYRSTDGHTYAIHFFAYSALAALPFRILLETGGDPLKAYQAANYLGLWVLGLSLFWFFGSAARAFAGLALFMASGAVLYLNWTSPEILTASCLLSGLVLAARQRPVAAGVLVGLAAMQNPPLVFFSIFAPLFDLFDTRLPPGSKFLGAVRALLAEGRLAGSVACGVLALLPFAFFQWKFGTPSLIATFSTDARLANLTRLLSYYLDPNQGMILAVPALPLLLLFCFPKQQRVRGALKLLAAVAFMFVLELPTLSTTNWNSAATGVMRYVVWGAIPLLFLAFSYLRDMPRWPLALLAAVFAVQVGAMVHDRQYGYTEFSPLGRYLLDHAPRLYNPEHEIFFERVVHADGSVLVDGVVGYPAHAPVKVLFNANSDAVHAALCGAGKGLADDSGLVEMPAGWRYVHAPFKCVARAAPREIRARAFADPASLVLREGWSGVELHGGDWDGVWSNGPRSRFLVPAAGTQFKQIQITGHYIPGVGGSRVIINGRDLGRFDLDVTPAIPLPPLRPGERGYEIELRHDVAKPLAPPDPRLLAFFLRVIKLR
jgi:hypothetical protein